MQLSENEPIVPDTLVFIIKVAFIYRKYVHGGRAGEMH